jgi:hypothetical protein
VGQWSRSTTPAGSQHPPALHHLRTCARVHLEQRAWEADALLAQILAARCEHASIQFSHTFRRALTRMHSLHSNVCLQQRHSTFRRTSSVHTALGDPPTTAYLCGNHPAHAVASLAEPPSSGHTARHSSCHASSIECVGVVASLVVVASRRGCFHVTSESRHSGLHLTHLTAQ